MNTVAGCLSTHAGRSWSSNEPRRYFLSQLSFSLCYLLPSPPPPPQTPLDSGPEQTDKTKAWFTVALCWWAGSESGGRPGTKSIYFFFFFFTEYAPTVLTQTRLYERTINSPPPAGSFIDSNRLLNNILRACSQKLLLCIDWKKGIQAKKKKKKPQRDVI